MYVAVCREAARPACCSVLMHGDHSRAHSVAEVTKLGKGSRGLKNWVEGSACGASWVSQILFDRAYASHCPSGGHSSVDLGCLGLSCAVRVFSELQSPPFAGEIVDSVCLVAHTVSPLPTLLLEFPDA